jgi:hypothetical protein
MIPRVDHDVQWRLGPVGEEVGLANLDDCDGRRFADLVRWQTGALE